MKSMHHAVLMAAAVAAVGLLATPGRASADSWGWGLHHGDDHARCAPICDKAPVSDKGHDKDCNHGQGVSSVPEIDPGGLTALGTILVGGMAVIGSRRRKMI